MPAASVAVRAVRTMACDLFIQILCQSSCNLNARMPMGRSAQPVIDKGGNPFGDLRDDPPPVRHIHPPTPALYRPDNLVGRFFGGRHPETAGPFCHFRIDKARLYVGEIEGDAHMSGFYKESFEIDALKGL